MARPIKQGLDSFTFDVSFSNDPTIVKIKKDFGCKGGYAVVELLCAIYSNGYFIEWDEKWQNVLLDKIPDAKTGMLNDIVTSLIKLGYFDENLFNSAGILTNIHIQQQYWEVYKERLRRRQKGNFQLVYWLLDGANSKELFRGETHYSAEKPSYSAEKPSYSAEKPSYSAEKPQLFRGETPVEQKEKERKEPKERIKKNNNINSNSSINSNNNTLFKNNNLNLNNNSYSSCAELSLQGEKDIFGDVINPNETPNDELSEFRIILNDGSDYWITKKDLEVFKSCYQAFNVEQELQRLFAWTYANPTKRKTRKGAKRFINAWLSRVQDNGNARNCYTVASVQRRVAPVPMSKQQCLPPTVDDFPF